MNKLFLIALAVCCGQCAAQKGDRHLENFKNQFELISLPFNSSSLNESQNLLLFSKKNQLTGEESLKYLLGNDKNKLEYRFEKFDMETGDSKGFENRSYKFYSVCRAETNRSLLFIVLRVSIHSQSYLLAVYNLEAGKVSDVIEINKIDAEEEYRLVQSSYLNKNLQLRIFKYEINPDYIKNLKTETNKSIITETSYNIDGGVKLLSSKSVKSQCSVADFYSKNKKCAEEDPMQALADDKPNHD
jgi:hypothetical protein